MNCIICNSPANYYFSKEYTEAPYDAFMKKIGPVSYEKCTNCGFVLSATHAALDMETWAELNFKAHTLYESSANNKLVNQPPYADQALMLVILAKKGIIDITDMLDYAAGYGTLSKFLNNYLHITLPIYDPYVQDDDKSNYVATENLKHYKIVLNSAMFEHVLKRADLDAVNDLVASDGCLILHTLICENVPADPNWFYLKPPAHTAFHTNKSMGILMSQWGYGASIYCPKSKSWVLLKSDSEKIEDAVTEINQELQTEYLIYKKGFVDYWKGFL